MVLFLGKDSPIGMMWTARAGGVRIFQRGRNLMVAISRQLATTIESSPVWKKPAKPTKICGVRRNNFCRAKRLSAVGQLIAGVATN